MRDYKDHSSRQPRPEAPARPTPRPVVAEPEETVEEEIAPRRGGSGWIWLILIALLLLSGAVWWWIASLPMTKGQLGLFPQAGTAAPVTPAASAVSKLTAAPVASVQSPPQKAARPTTTVAPPVAPLASAVSPSASTSSTVQFNFYHILPQMKVDIPSDILGSGPGIPAAETSSAASGGPVRIQVGALNNLAGAQVIRERLELMGISSHLQELRGPDGASYYQVLTRSYASSSDAQTALTKIRGMGITPVLRSAASMPSVAPLASPAR